MERRLTAIMAADVVGYSRLMGANEVATLNELTRRRKEVIEPAVARHQGRIVKLTGDGILADFPSAAGAVHCAQAIQEAMDEANATLPGDRRIELRIGINIGDVIDQDDDIFGDGVNIAARIEGVGRPGAVTVSALVRDHVAHQADLRFADLGEFRLKNIEHPLRLFELASAAAPSAPSDLPAATGERPSIAVLPFTNMSGDHEQEYFSDGICEDVITDLSKLSGLFVVGRNTSFTYKGQSVQLTKVARELGVKFLLEGSVRKAGDRVRITAQLIDGETGGHVWADRYDRDLTDIFAIQDEITAAIVDQLKVQLFPVEKAAMRQQPTASVAAYDFFLKARQNFHNATRFFLGQARQALEHAVALDPSFARAHAMLALCDVRRVGWYGEALPVDAILAHADRALAIDPDLAEAHAARGDALSLFDRVDEAEDAFRRALALDPDNFDVNLLYARFCAREGRYEDSATYYRRALELNPEDPQAPLLLHDALRALGQIEEADRYSWMGIRRAEETLRRHPEWSRPAALGACALAAVGETDEARRWIERALAVDPDDMNTLYNVACCSVLLGDEERALDLLERWAARPGREKAMWLRHDHDLAPLRGHPRYLALLDHAGKLDAVPG